MGRKFIPVTAGSNQYKVFLKDIKYIHKFNNKKRPPLPKYDKEVVLTQTFEEIEIEVEF